MPQGKVGPGDQNDFKPIGTIYELPYESGSNHKYPRDIIKFKKGRVNKNTSRNDNECWSAGTPVAWDGDDVSKAKTVTIQLAGIPDMLVSTDPETGAVIEYHPVITFFNEVMAQIMRDGRRAVIGGLEKKENAVKMWKYLERKYLIVASKKRSPVKKNKLAKRGRLVKKK